MSLTHVRYHTLKIDAIFIFNDPRDWALDTQIIIDLLLSHAGHLGTLSKLNGDTSLPNNGYQQDEQPPLYFSNPDLWWAAAYHLPRLGQGGYREALEGVWRAVTGGEGQGIELQKTMFGKPHKITFAFAENKLANHRLSIFGHGKTTGVLKRVYMILPPKRLGSTESATDRQLDNPESDIRGANEYKSSGGSEWQSILVRSGVYNGGEPAWKPKVILDDVWDAVQWGIESSAWK
ncbi:hypothetical protein MMC20_001397 [Loxospora ochrophaea]|nr:hypothetical protein [Loxospora ochrophaea]